MCWRCWRVNRSVFIFLTSNEKLIFFPTDSEFNSHSQRTSRFVHGEQMGCHKSHSLSQLSCMETNLVDFCHPRNRGKYKSKGATMKGLFYAIRKCDSIYEFDLMRYEMLFAGDNMRSTHIRFDTVHAEFRTSYMADCGTRQAGGLYRFRDLRSSLKHIFVSTRTSRSRFKTSHEFA